MKKEYESLLSSAKVRYAQNEKCIHMLSKKKIRDFEDTVQSLHEEAFQKIDCSLCANCCRVLGPRLNETDINRLASLFRMKRGSFVARYLQVDEDGDHVFKSMPCPFIQDDNRCFVYDARPRACVEYPHTDEKNVHAKLFRLLTNTLYCPAAFLVVEGLREKFGQ